MQMQRLNISTSSKQDIKKIKCQECKTIIKPNQVYYRCPKKSDSYAICLKCWKKETRKYTGSITLGQRVRIKINKNEWKLGSILKHWPDDDTYTIQLDGETRQDAQAYDIYDSEWDIQLVEKDQLKPMPTRMLSQIDTELTAQRSVPRGLTGCRMISMDARDVYHDDIQDIVDGKKLQFHSEEDGDDIKEISEEGVYCNKCGGHIKSGKIYHCPNQTHEDGYDLCLKCSKNVAKKPPKLKSYDIEGIAQFIKSGDCKRIGLLVGAGISRSAGIPDFRSSDGIYKSLSKDLGKNAVKYGLTMQQKKRLKRMRNMYFRWNCLRKIHVFYIMF